MVFEASRFFEAHGSGARCPVLFWSSPSTFQEEVLRRGFFKSIGDQRFGKRVKNSDRNAEFGPCRDLEISKFGVRNFDPWPDVYSISWKRQHRGVFFVGALELEGLRMLEICNMNCDQTWVTHDCSWVELLRKNIFPGVLFDCRGGGTRQHTIALNCNPWRPQVHEVATRDASTRSKVGTWGTTWDFSLAEPFHSAKTSGCRTSIGRL